MKATVVALLFAAGTFAQMLPTFPKPVTQSTAWNSSSKFSEEQIELGQLWPDLADNLETILNFDRSQLANDGPSRDIFYQLNNDTCFDPPHTPGQVLKVQYITNPAAWNIPPRRPSPDLSTQRLTLMAP